MLSTTFHILLVVSFAASYLAISRRIDERIGGAAALILWALTAASALSHEVVVGDSLVSTSAPSVAIFATGSAFVMLAFTFAAATGSLIESHRYETKS